MPDEDTIEWWTQYRVHPRQPWRDATTTQQESEAEARFWLGAWDRGGVVHSARIIRKQARIVAEYVRSEVPSSQQNSADDTQTVADEQSVWSREREHITLGGHRFVGYGAAEEACDHGRAAHLDSGCTKCDCRVTYSGGLAGADGEN